MYKFSATQWIYGNEDITSTLERLKKYGYDGIELTGEPYDIDLASIKSLLSNYELICTSICGIYTPRRDLSSNDESIRANAVQYVKDCVDSAAEVGASHVIVVPTSVGKLAPETTRHEEWGNAVQSIKEAGEYALSKSINLAIESLNRYESYLVNNMETALAFRQEVDVDSVKLMADLFHMNIEERDIRESIIKIKPHLVHVHIADNTREAAGLGETNFAKVIDTLKEINYQGPITMEFLPSVSNPYLVAQNSGEKEVYDFYTQQSINHIKELVGEFK